MMQNKVRVIGITGITGSGTSTVAGLLKEKGGLVISADCLAHDAIKKGQEAYIKIVEKFGKSILLTDGEINRKALGAVVFGEENQENRAWLESIVHPAVLSIIREQIRGCEGQFVVIDAPLLIESGLDKECDEVWLVTADDEARASRIIKRDGVDKATAEKRLKSRQNERNLARHADVVIENNGDYMSLRGRVENLRKNHPLVT